jgi:hypothetical protein
MFSCGQSRRSSSGLMSTALAVRQRKRDGANAVPEIGNRNGRQIFFGMAAQAPFFALLLRQASMKAMPIQPSSTLA